MTTSQLTEGSNLYFTEQRVDEAFDILLSTKTTSQLSEGSNLLLYSTHSPISSLRQKYNPPEPHTFSLLNAPLRQFNPSLY